MESPGTHPRELLSAYLDGELPEAESTGVEEHLSGCPGCRILLEDFRAVAAAAAREQPPEIPADLTARIRGLIASHARVDDSRRSRRELLSYRLAWAAAAGVVVVTGLYALRQGSAPPSARPAAPPVEPETLSSKVDVRSEVAPMKKATPPGTIARQSADARARVLPPPVALKAEPKTAAGPQPAPAGARPGRVLRFDYPTHRISVFEDGTVSVSAAGYACSARSDPSSGDPDIASLFALASPAARQPAATRGLVSKDAPAVRLSGAPAAAGGDSDEVAGTDLPAEKRAEMEARLRVLMRDRYLALLEERCGPAPESLRSP
jgi:putative zinc finger protein